MPSSACDWSSDVCSSDRSEEHTSELQSRSDLVCRLLLEKKKRTDSDAGTPAYPQVHPNSSRSTRNGQLRQQNANNTPETSAPATGTRSPPLALLSRPL